MPVWLQMGGRKAMWRLRRSTSRLICLVAWLAAVNACQARTRTIDVDTVWTGTRVRFDAIEANGIVFVAYYDRDRWLTLARIGLADGSVQKTRLDTRFAGWDSHNYISLAFDEQLRLHVSGNMHASPLVYFRGEAPLSIELAPASMIGRDERQVSYPTFLGSGTNDLLFFYRAGSSGRGDWFFNRWNGHTWARVPGPIFAKESSFGHVSAYPSRFLRGPDGIYHVAVIWRKNENVESNFRVSYARTRDFVHWTNSHGKPLALPLSPDNTEVVDDPGEGKGLLNNPQIALDPKGSPVISYSKYGDSGTNAVTVVFRAANGWAQRQVAHGPTLTKLQGRGTLPESPGVGPVVFPPTGDATITYSFPGTQRFMLALNPTTFVPVGAPARDTKPAFSSANDKVAGTTLTEQVVPVRQSDGSTLTSLNQIVWSAQGTNRDLPWQCNDEHPIACTPPPAKLRLVLPAQ